jgi:4-amino-4-deoxy-L-arabinose transferase-like glycosyltransferase
VTFRTYPRTAGHLPTVAVAGRARDPARATFLVGLIGVLALVAVTAPFMSRYGWDRDELYFLSAAHHLAFGYVDFPPLIAVVGWLVDKLAPGSLVALRMVSLAAGAATVILVAFIARELGGGRRAQWIAALSWALTPYILGSASIFHPTWLDALAWTSFLYVAVRLLVRREPRLWLLLGLIAGVGLEAKYTIGFLVLAFTAALILGGERRQLASMWPWLRLAIAIALLAPNLVWQVQHAWPSVHFFASQNAQTASGTSRPAYIAQQLLFLGSTAVLAGAGVVWLWRRELRTLALIPVLVTALFLLERGRSYYPLPADALAVAAGAVALDGWLRTRRRLALLASGLALQAAVIALAGPIVIPFYSTRQLVNSSIWRIGYFKDEIGWPEMTAQVERSWATLPAPERASGAVLAHNYGEASALEFYGRGLPTILSGHLSWQYWHPKRLPDRFVLTVGYQTPGLEVLCSSWTVLARIDNRWHLDNEEHGQPIAACTLKRPLASDWTALIATDRL